MRCEPPDLQFYAEIRDLNLEFLELIVEAHRMWGRSVFALDGVVLGQIGSLQAAQLEAIASVPCLLAGFAPRRPFGAPAFVAEPRSDGDGAWNERLRLFAAGLWSYIWQMVRHDSLRAALCAGTPQAAQLGAMSFRDMRCSGEQARQHLQARFPHGRFWPDLVRAAQDGRAEDLRLARLSAIQLATSEARMHQGYAVSQSAPLAGVGTAS